MRRIEIVWAPIVLASVLCITAVTPEHALADVMSPAPPCPPGMDRGSAGMGGSFGHDGPPECAPAWCENASTCALGQACRRDAHCLIERTERELRLSPGHGAPPPDPEDPTSYVEVTRTYDIGACVEGACPGASTCRMVTACRPIDAVDEWLPATAEERGGPATGPWSRALTYDGSPLGPIDTRPAPPRDEAPAPATAAPATSASTPAAPPSSSFCTAHVGHRPLGPVAFGLVALGLVALLLAPARRRRAPVSSGR